MFSSTMIYCNIIGIFAWPIFSSFAVYLFIAFFFSSWDRVVGEVSASATLRDSCHGNRSSGDKGGGPSQGLLPYPSVLKYSISFSVLPENREMFFIFSGTISIFFFFLLFRSFNMLSSSRICWRALGGSVTNINSPVLFFLSCYTSVFFHFLMLHLFFPFRVLSSPPFFFPNNSHSNFCILFHRGNKSWKAYTMYYGHLIF